MKHRIPLKARLALAAVCVVAAVVVAPSAAPQDPVVVLTLEPRAATNPVGTAHTITGTTTTLTGVEVSGVPVHIDVLGSSEGSTDCLSPCVFTYIGPQEPGADLIRGFVDSDGDARQDLGEPGDAVSKAWFDPVAPETGSATGGGHALDPLLGEFGFGFRASTTDGGPVGHCRIVNRNNGDQISCLTVDFVSIVGTHVMFSGMADVNGSVESYTIDADDLDPGTDLFQFQSLTREYQGPASSPVCTLRIT